MINSNSGQMAVTLTAGAVTLAIGLTVGIFTQFEQGQQAIENNRILKYENHQLRMENRDLKNYQAGYERATTQSN